MRRRSCVPFSMLFKPGAIVAQSSWLKEVGVRHAGRQIMCVYSQTSTRSLLRLYAGAIDMLAAAGAPEHGHTARRG